MGKGRVCAGFTRYGHRAARVFNQVLKGEIIPPILAQALASLDYMLAGRLTSSLVNWRGLR